jgi:hypothetical protein
MAITYTWKITSLKVRDVGPKTNAVVQTYWQKTGTDENANTGTFSGATPFTVDPTDSNGPFIPFEDLTEENVVNWIKTVVVGGYEEHVNGVIAKQIEDKIVPITEPKMPWAPEPAPAPQPEPAPAPAPV